MFDEKFLVVELRKDLGVGCNANDGGRGYIAKPVFQFYFCYDKYPDQKQPTEKRIYLT